MKLRHFSFAGALALAACGPTLPQAGKPTELTPCQKELPAPVELGEPTQIDPKDGNSLVLVADETSKLGGYLAYQVDVSTRTVRKTYKIEPAKLGGLLIPSLDKAGQLIIVRPNPPPPPDGHDRLKALINLINRMAPAGGPAAQCQPGFDPVGPQVPIADPVKPVP